MSQSNDSLHTSNSSTTDLHDSARITEARLSHITQSLSRIREARRNILQLSNSRQLPTSMMDPGHESILLTNQDVQTGSMQPSHGEVGDPLDAMNIDVRALIPDETWDRLDMYDLPGRSQASTQPTRVAAPSQRPGSLPPLDVAVGPFFLPSELSQPSSSGVNSPMDGMRERQRHPLQTRRSVLESLMRPNVRREYATNPEDPNTILGRRVAAREAAGSSVPPASAGPFSDAEQRAYLGRRPEMHHDLAQYRANLRERRTDPVVIQALAAPVRRSVDVQTVGTPESPSAALSPGAMRSPPSSAFPQGRRWYRRPRSNQERTTSTATSSEGSQDNGRLSLLSNMGSMHNLASPLSATVGRPLLFEEPDSFLEASSNPVPPPLPPTATNVPYLRHESDGARPSLYHLSRREDYLQSISSANLIGASSDDEDIESWLVSPESRRRHDQMFPHHPMRTVTRRPLGPGRGEHSPTPSGSRQRGWVRLDPDGNEISVEEEMELERRRTDYRIAALDRNPPHLVHQTTPQQITRSTIDPTTRVQPPGEEESTPPRVRLSSSSIVAMPQRNYYGSVLDSVLNINAQNTSAPTRIRRWVPPEPMDGEGGLIGSATEFKPDPLPMPLESMVTRPRPKINAPQAGGMIIIPGRVWAGR